MAFKGCIREVEAENENLREKPLDLTYKENDPTRVFVNVKKCGCKDLKCENGGTCEPRETDFRCQCKLGFTGPQCQIESKCFAPPRVPQVNLKLIDGLDRKKNAQGVVVQKIQLLNDNTRALSRFTVLSHF